jgi:Ca-activated chloride channel family protein
MLNVVILSDGMTEQRERRTLLRLIGERPGSTRVFAIGVGNDVNRPLLEQLAEDAGGLAAFISRGDNFERQARAFRRKLLRPAVTNLEIAAVGGGLYDVEPRTLPNLYHGMPIRLYGRYASPGPMELKIHGNIGGELFERSLQVELPGDDADNPEIERMWAWHRVQRLQKDADRSGNREQVIDEIVRLGEGYSIVTEYTSFLVLENDAEYRRWKIDRRNAARLERDRRKLRRVRAELESMRAKSASEVGPVNRAAAKNDAGPQRQTTGTPASATPAPVQPPRSRKRGIDLDFGGGGAFDPFTTGLVLSLGGATFAAYRRRRNRRS